MKDKDTIENILTDNTNLDMETLEKINDTCCALSDKQKDRILDIIEQKTINKEQTKDIINTTESKDSVKIITYRRNHMKLIISAVACICLLISSGLLGKLSDHNITQKVDPNETTKSTTTTLANTEKTSDNNPTTTTTPANTKKTTSNSTLPPETVINPVTEITTLPSTTNTQTTTTVQITENNIVSDTTTTTEPHIIKSDKINDTISYDILDNGFMKIYGKGVIPSFDFDKTLVKCIVIENHNGNIIGIGQEAFKNCTKLESIKFPDTLEFIDDSAFTGCTALTEIIIPDNVINIGYKAFADCINLKKAQLGKSVEYFGISMFYNCPELSEIVIPCNEYSYLTDKNGEIIFDHTEWLLSRLFATEDDILPVIDTLKKVTINNVSDGAFIRNAMFHTMHGLTEITIPEGINYIGASAFLGCNNLSEIKIPEGVKRFYECAFVGCSSLKEIYLPDSLEAIEAAAFGACSSLEELVIPANVKEIGKDVFWGCTNLKKITIYAMETTFGEEALNNSIATIYCYENSDAHKYALENNIKFVLMEK